MLCGDLSPTVPTSLFLSKVTTTTIIDNINYEQGSCYVYSVRAININGAGPSSEVRYRTTGTSIKGPFTLTGVGLHLVYLGELIYMTMPRILLRVRVGKFRILRRLLMEAARFPIQRRLES